ncbi:MAG TPA: bifunctional diguanylate cyclase/phosphodiesterase [Pseudolabrys sp.]|nr:bifunctional diguanylate cyclase/phosphodiesterase [Pseudolabrys sp.]
MTGLVNRSTFVRELRLVTEPDLKNFAVLYLDLDHFKDVNDTMGRAAGDRLLRAVAERLRAIVRENDSVARFGGDEFAILQTGISDSADAVALAEKVQKALGEPFSIDGSEILTQASIGIALSSPDLADAETILARADLAVYRAKSEGRGTYKFFSEALDREVRDRVNLGIELREALASGQFFLMYQPQVDVDTGRILGLEALARWRHPTRGLIAPGKFIPAAESNGLIVPLGHWVLHEACRQMKNWLDVGIAPPMIGVNVSGLQFKVPLELENDVAAILAETALPPGLLELEFTETLLIGLTLEHDDALQRLRRIGLRIAIDDFGTGYSSLEYLGRIPVNRIKISQNFMTNLTPTTKTAKIVKAAIGMAHELGLDVVIEGVETAEQLAMVKSFNGRKVQGYYFSKPLPADETTALLRVGKIIPVRPTAIEPAAA